MPASPRLRVLAPVLALALSPVLPGQETKPLAPATVITAEEVSGLVEIHPGALPIILLAPHGGGQKPKGFAARTFGKLATDSNTAELTRLLAGELEKQYGAAPTSILSLLHRSRLDPNREIKEAAQDDPNAIAVWNRYHGAAGEAVKRVTQAHGAGLLLDIHGQRHEDKRVEIGMLLTGKDLAITDEALNASAALLAKSSVRELDKRSPQTFAELIRGKQSLGGLLEARGFKSIPTPAKPAPAEGAAYFSGSYDITAHGSRDKGSVSAIQIECPWEGVRDTPENRQRFATALAKALGEFFQAHYGMALGKTVAADDGKPAQ